MADRIKGITIEIDGDTSKLSKALKDVNSELKQSQNNLKDIDKLLKFDPGNTTLLQQKYKTLGTEIEATKKKLETLKTAESQASQALANGDITEQEFEALQREIVETEQKLKSLTKEFKEFGSVSAQQVAAAGEKMKDVGSKVEGAGKAIMPASMAMAGLGTAAVKTASDFDSAMSTVSAVSGATGKDLEALRDKAKEMGEKTVFSASEAAEAMNYMAMAGWKTEDMLSGIEGVMNLAAASGEDLATTSDIVTDALTAFGLSAKDSGHFADILAAASSNANTNVSMMGETFKYAAPIAGAMGYSAEDTAVAIGLMANSGIKASQAGTSLRKIMTELQGEIVISGEALGEMTIQTTNSDGTMRELSEILGDCRVAFSQLSESEKAATAEALVGKTGMSGFLAIMNAGEDDVNKLTEAINNCNGSAKEMADTKLDNLEGQIKLLKSQLESLAISLGEILIPIVRDVVGHISKFVEWLNSLSDGQKKLVVTIMAVVAAAGPLLITIGKLLQAVGTIMTWAPKLVSAFNGIKTVASALGGGLQALWGVLMANPIILVIAAVAALVAGFIYLWNHCEGFRQFWIDLWENIKSIVSTAITNIKTSISNGLNAAKSTVTNVLNAIKQTFSNIWNGAINIVKGAVDKCKSLMNFSWSLPKLKLPHLKISGSFSIDPPSVPHFSIDWYKKAMADGMILNSPTIFGAAGGKLLGGGEAGPEAVVGVDSLRNMIGEAVAAAAGNMGGDITIPVYIGQRKLDTLVVDAVQRANYRSGGR